MSDLRKLIEKENPSPSQSYEVTISSVAIASMVRTAMMVGAQMVLAKARRGRFVSKRKGVSVAVVEYETIRKFIQGEK
jgi:hypothetical protein